MHEILLGKAASTVLCSAFLPPCQRVQSSSCCAAVRPLVQALLIRLTRSLFAFPAVLPSHFLWIIGYSRTQLIEPLRDIWFILRFPFIISFYFFFFVAGNSIFFSLPFVSSIFIRGFSNPNTFSTISIQSSGTLAFSEVC